MAYQQTLTAFASDAFLRDAEVLRKTLLTQKIEILKYGIFIPDSFIAEMEMFASRNILSNEINPKYLTAVPKEVCPHCLKAHALRHAELLGLPADSKAFLETALPGKNGHNGYYTDQGQLIKAEHRETN